MKRGLCNERKKKCSNPIHSTKDADVYCSQCDKFYCTMCESMFHSPTFKNHMPAVEPVNTQAQSQLPQPKLQKSKPSEALEYLCENHRTLCTEQSLAEGQHQGCRLVKLDSAGIEKCRKSLATNLEALKRALSAAKAFPMGLLEKQNAAVDASIASVRQAIKSAFAVVRRAVDAREAELLRRTEEFSSGSDCVCVAIAGVLDTNKAAAAIACGKKALSEADPSAVVLCGCEVQDALNRLKSALQKATDVLCCGAQATAGCFGGHLMRDIGEYGSVEMHLGKPCIAIRELTYKSVVVEWASAGPCAVYCVELRNARGGPFEVLYSGNWNRCKIDSLTPNTLYELRMSVQVNEVWCSAKGEAMFSTPAMPERSLAQYAWKRCPAETDMKSMYLVDAATPRVVTKVLGDEYCTVVGKAPVPPPAGGFVER